MVKEHPFNRYLREHYHYKVTEEEEIRTQIYKNKNTTDLISMVTIMKNTRFKTKAYVRPVVVSGKIYLDVAAIYYDETVTPAEAKQLKEDMKKQVTKDNILIRVKEADKDTFDILRARIL